MDLASQELDSVSHGYFRYCFVFHLLLFGHYVCLELKFERFSLSTMCHGIGCDFNKSDATVQALHLGWNGFPSIALQSRSRTRQSVEIFTSVAEFRRTRNFAGKQVLSNAVQNFEPRLVNYVWIWILSLWTSVFYMHDWVICLRSFHLDGMGFLTMEWDIHSEIG